MSNVAAVRAVVFQEGDVWVAQCLEYDICAQANTVNEAKARLLATIRFEYEQTLTDSGVPFAGIDRAPRQFEEMWANASQRPAVELQVPNGRAHIDVSMGIAA
ncbi:MAG TPA: hypothetical protein PKA13_21535 [Geminicoccaceae bacterium]|nr:hypothetical protein [Geminicoccus sp.]HMU52377.1 hypothetical protein [Geminicoccaceae bacterium]